jgi:hypothetical protein
MGTRKRRRVGPTNDSEQLDSSVSGISRGAREDRLRRLAFSHPDIERRGSARWNYRAAGDPR